MRRLTSTGKPDLKDSKYRDYQISHNGMRSIHNDSDIVNVLRDAVNCESSDPRDRIYALLDMTSTSIKYKDLKQDQVLKINEPSIEIDYTKSDVEVFTDVARYVLEREGNLLLLYSSGTYGQRSELSFSQAWIPDWEYKINNYSSHVDLNLPSWVPDWRYKIDYGSSHIFAYLSRTQVESVSSTKYGLNFELGTLRCQGFTYGRIWNYQTLDKLLNTSYIRNLDSVLAKVQSFIRNSPIHEARESDVITQILSGLGPLHDNSWSRLGIKAVVGVQLSTKILSSQSTGKGKPQMEPKNHLEHWLTSAILEVDTVIVKLDGGAVPLLLQPVQTEGQYRIIGPVQWYPATGDSTAALVCDSLEVELQDRKDANMLESFTLV